MGKSPDAFRTITEVSDWLETPTHVLRFWETKFAALRPVKRAGGRRYYRPADMALLAGIKALLHDQGMTIKGVEKLLKEKGARFVAGLGTRPIDGEPWLGEPASLSEELLAGLPDPGQELAEAGDDLSDGLGPDEDFALPPPPAEPEGEEALTFLDAVLAGTARRLREGAAEREAQEQAESADAGSIEAEDAGEPFELIPFPEDPARAPALNGARHAPASDPSAGPPSPARLLALLRGADPALLRARAARLAPLVDRLRAACAPPLRPPPDSL